MTEPKQVLIVDDEADFRAVLSFVLKGAGYLVHSANDGTQGLERFRALRPDLLLLDVNMPGLGGMDLCRRVRQEEVGRRTPILMLTVRSEIQIAAECVSAGATDYILKPFDDKDLLRRVARALE